jgi:hypothetical protein
MKPPHFDSGRQSNSLPQIARSKSCASLEHVRRQPTGAELAQAAQFRKQYRLHNIQSAFAYLIHCTHHWPVSIFRYRVATPSAPRSSRQEVLDLEVRIVVACQIVKFFCQARETMDWNDPAEVSIDPTFEKRVLTDDFSGFYAPGRLQGTQSPKTG